MTQDRNSEKIRIVIVDAEETTRSAIKAHLGSSEYEVVGESPDIEAGQQLVQELRPDLLFLTVGADETTTFEATRKIREELPGTAIVLMSYDATPQLILSSMRAGAHEFLTQPLEKNELDGAMVRLRKVLVPPDTSRPTGGAVYATYPAKGGVGASSLATNLALALKSQNNSRVVLVDFNLQVGDLSLMLDMTPQHSFASAVGDGTIDEIKLRTMLAHHTSGLALLTMADRPEESNLVRRKHVAALFNLLQGIFDYIVVDLGRHIDERTIELLDHSDVILLVTALDVPTIRNTRSYLDLFRRLEIAPQRIRLVVNRLQEGRRITNHDLVRTVGREIFYGIPNDYVSTSSAIDSGNPVVLNSPRSKLAENYRELARALTASREGAGASESAATRSKKR